MEFYGGIWEVHAASPYLNGPRLAPNQFFQSLHYGLASGRPASAVQLMLAAQASHSLPSSPPWIWLMVTSCVRQLGWKSRHISWSLVLSYVFSVAISWSSCLLINPNLNLNYIPVIHTLPAAAVPSGCHQLAPYLVAKSQPFVSSSKSFWHRFIDVWIDFIFGVAQLQDL
jgi:hypothetical protein